MAVFQFSAQLLFLASFFQQREGKFSIFCNIRLLAGSLCKYKYLGLDTHNVREAHELNRFRIFRSSF